jgi:dipeptidyl aminopeptidase/acylaminoacyl peptidase
MTIGRLRLALPSVLLAALGTGLPAPAQDPAPALPADTAPRIDARVVRNWKHPGPVSAVSFSPDGRLVMSAGPDGTVALWDREGDRQARAIRAHTGRILAASFAANGRQILTAGADGTISRWETETGNLLQTFPALVAPSSAVAFTRNGRLAVSLSEGYLVQWDLENGTGLLFQGPRHSPAGVSLSPDGRTALSAHRCSSTLFIWSEDAAALLHARNVQPTDAATQGFSPDSQFAVTGGYRGRLTLWDVARGEPRRTIEDEGLKSVGCVAFSPDGSILLAGNRSAGPTHLYDTATGRRLGAWNSSGMPTAEFSPGGRDIAVGQTDGSILVWRTGPDAEGRPAGLENALADFDTPDGGRWVRAREAVIGLGDEAVGAILRTWPPGAAAPVLPDTDLARLRVDLDDDDFEVRVRAREALERQGERILPWLDAQLKRPASLPAETLTALAALRRSAEFPSPVRTASLGQLRAVMALAEMPRTAAVLRALASYADGPPDSGSAALARRASRP